MIISKITIITNGTLPVPSTKGGAVENLVEVLIRFNEIFKDFQLNIFSVHDDKSKLLASQYKNTHFYFIETKSFSYKFGRALRFLINKLRRGSLKNQFIYQVSKQKQVLQNSDLILIENNPDFLPFVRKITTGPIGLHLHNDYLNKDRMTYSKKMLNGIDFVIGVSKYITSRVDEISPKNCKINFVYNGISLERFGNTLLKKDRNELRSRYGIFEEDIVIIYAGRILESKGVKFLIKNFIELSEKFSIKLLIVGSSGFENSRKNNFMKEMELLTNTVRSKIIFTGYVNYDDIHRVYSLADIAVSPSIAIEAFGLTTIEALASGLPVIVSDSGGMPEVVDNTCGFVIQRDANFNFNLKKKLELLIVNEELRHKMSISAKKRALLFSDINYYKSLSSYLKAAI